LQHLSGPKFTAVMHLCASDDMAARATSPCNIRIHSEAASRGRWVVGSLSIAGLILRRQIGRPRDRHTCRSLRDRTDRALHSVGSGSQSRQPFCTRRYSHGRVRILESGHVQSLSSSRRLGEAKYVLSNEKVAKGQRFVDSLTVSGRSSKYAHPYLLSQSCLCFLRVPRIRS
jgi:hypothetical protein